MPIRHARRPARSGNEFALAHLLPASLLLAASLLGTTFARAAPAPGAPATAGCGGSRVALVIGDRSYPDADAPLQGTVEGAKRVADALLSIGFEVQLGEDLTRVKMNAAVRDFVAQIKPGTAAFLYFAGYGMQASGHTYLLPVDASIWSEADILAGGINLDRVLAEIAERKASVAVVVIDAARRNPYESRFRAAGSIGLAPPSAVAGNLVALYSAAPGKVIDARDPQGDSFGDDVAREITAPHATAQEAFRQVRALVERTSHAGQTPWGFTTLASDLPLDARDCSAPAAKGPATITAAKLPAAIASPSSPPRQADAATAPASASPATASPPTPGPTQVATTPSGVKSGSETDAGQRSRETLHDAAQLAEVRERLFEQGFDPGPAGSATMRAAIVNYERKAGLPPSEEPTIGLLDALRASRSPTPWGAIIVSDDIKNWGMAWDQPTRAKALADAKAKCGSDRCLRAISFSGHDCGAFALSAKRWNVSNRDASDAARKAALEACGQTGPTCRIIGVVCADGSGRSD